MESGIIDVNGVPTEVVTYGGWIEQEDLRDNEVMLVIPGNPGMVEFYNEFLNTIHRETSGMTVWGVSFAGHSPGTVEVYSLEEQIQHKIAFIQKFVPRNTAVTLIGHSIGCYIAIEIMKRMEGEQKFHMSYMIFPTIERMAESPNGQFFGPVLKYLTWLIVFWVKILSYLPVRILETIVKTFIYYYKGTKKLADCSLSASVALINSNVLKNVSYLAQDEFQSVRELDVMTLKKFSHFLILYYGTTDKWCPLSYYHNIKKTVPMVNAIVDKEGIKHDFVLFYSREMGEIIAKWVLNRK